jgi:hypothetical protein
MAARDEGYAPYRLYTEDGPRCAGRSRGARAHLYLRQRPRGLMKRSMDFVAARLIDGCWFCELINNELRGHQRPVQVTQLTLNRPATSSRRWPWSSNF